MKKFSSLFFVAIFFITNSLVAQVAPPMPTDPAAAPSPAAPTPFVYGGFSIDDTAVQDAFYKQNIRTELQYQIQVIYDLGLSGDVISFFKSVPVQVTTNTKVHSSYDLHSKTIFLNSDILPFHDADSLVFLQALLCAFQDQKLPNGASALKPYFKEAQKNSAYYPSAWMFSSADSGAAFFEATSMAYLFGVFPEEPYCRQKLQQNQPDYAAYLKQLFGSSSGSYQGYLAADFFSSGGFSYGGFYIDDTFFNNSEYGNALRETLKRQIDMVNAAGLPVELLNFLKTIPIMLVRNLNAYFGDASGIYLPEANVIKISGDDLLYLDDSNYSYSSEYNYAVLLHELMHAFHHQLLPQGFYNPSIIYYFNEANTRHLYNDISGQMLLYLEAMEKCGLKYQGYLEQREYLFTDCEEFFAVTASNYLSGYQQDIQEPSSPSDIKQEQPDYYSYLQKIFGSSNSYNVPVPHSSFFQTFLQCLVSGDQDDPINSPDVGGSWTLFTPAVMAFF